MHARGVVPHKKWLIRFMSPVYEIKRKFCDFFINGLHALHVQRPSILNLAIRDGVNYTSGADLLGNPHSPVRLLH